MDTQMIVIVCEILTVLIGCAGLVLEIRRK